jgi:hypothetical protein
MRRVRIAGGDLFQIFLSARRNEEYAASNDFFGANVMSSIRCAVGFVVGFATFVMVVRADAPPAGVSVDSRYNNVLFKAPNPAKWTRTQQDSKAYLIANTPGSVLAWVSIFPGRDFSGDFRRQFDDSTKALLGGQKIVQDSGDTATKSPEGFDVLQRVVVLRTAEGDSYHWYFALHPANHFDMITFDAKGRDQWDAWKGDVTDLMRSVKMYNALPADALAALPDELKTGTNVAPKPGAAVAADGAAPASGQTSAAAAGSSGTPAASAAAPPQAQPTPAPMPAAVASPPPASAAPAATPAPAPSAPAVVASAQPSAPPRMTSKSIAASPAPGPAVQAVPASTSMPPAASPSSDPLGSIRSALSSANSIKSASPRMAVANSTPAAAPPPTAPAPASPAFAAAPQAASLAAVAAAPPPPAPTKLPRSAPRVTSAAGSVAPGHLAGRVTDAGGNPLNGAQIDVVGVSGAGSDAKMQVATDASGRYDAVLPDGYYTAQGWYPIEYNGMHYRLPLDSADGQTTQTAYDTSKGVSLDWVWRIQGLRNGASPDSRSIGDYRGAAIYLTEMMAKPFRVASLPKDGASAISFELKPDGKLIDGQSGSPITRKVNYPFQSGEDRVLLDLPIGRYQISAKLLMKDGTSKDLHLSVIPPKIGQDAPAPAASAAIDFAPGSGPAGPEGLVVGQVFVGQ